MAADSQRKSFTITWRVENCKFCEQVGDNGMSSPSICIDTLDNTSFRLWLNLIWPKSEEYMYVTIIRGKYCSLPVIIELDYDLSLFSEHSPSPLFEASSSHAFQKGYRSPPFLIPKAKVFERKEEELLPPDNITIQFKIWKKLGSLSEDGECTLTTEAQVERISFVGMVENFSELTPDKKKAIRIRSAFEKIPLSSMNMGMTCEGIIFIEFFIPLSGTMIRLYKCVLYLLDNKGNEVKCGEGELSYRPLRKENSGKIPLQFSKINLMDLEKQYLQNDCLSLQCEIAFLTECKNKLVKTKYAAILTKCTEQATSGVRNNEEIVQEVNPSISTVKDDLLSLLSTGLLFDTKLRTSTETFPAHKNILSARSPVFRAMFTNEKESTDDSVQIDDLDTNTVRRFLLFLYSDNLEDLDFESAKNLYFAGDKYGVFSLKHKCSHFLEENLCSSNCCDILMLADRHSDSDLKKSAQECIAQHDKEVLLSDQWKLLEETNTNLAFETFRIMYKKNRRNS
ncbi:Speckle-type POZ protein [Araneus ventricosus]|uniref:Speckle-type POZ protein n=1 Tax=Araneus ventricosus TaxID=182803 RepID=A0A4Y2QT37_ARAVE|nr:Speckle-type POZ protein [Araneus ventricosus]